VRIHDAPCCTVFPALSVPLLSRAAAVLCHCLAVLLLYLGPCALCLQAGLVRNVMDQFGQSEGTLLGVGVPCAVPLLSCATADVCPVPSSLCLSALQVAGLSEAGPVMDQSGQTEGTLLGVQASLCCPLPVLCHCLIVPRLYLVPVPSASRRGSVRNVMDQFGQAEGTLLGVLASSLAASSSRDPSEGLECLLHWGNVSRGLRGTSRPLSAHPVCLIVLRARSP